PLLFEMSIKFASVGYGRVVDNLLTSALSGLFPRAWPPGEKATARKNQARQTCSRDGTGDPAHAATRDSVVETVGAPCHNGWDRAYYHPTAQEEVMMAFTAMLSELYMVPSAARSVRMNRPLRLPPRLW